MPGKLSISGDYANQMLTVENKSSQKLESVLIECGFFNVGELLAIGEHVVRNIQPGSVGYGEVISSHAGETTRTDCRIVSVIGYRGSSRSKTAQIQIESLITSLELYNIDVGTYPTTADGLDAPIKAPAKALGWNGPYVTKDNIPPDPWGQRWRYQLPGKKGAFDLFSLGRDGKEGGSDEDADIRN